MTADQLDMFSAEHGRDGILWLISEDPKNSRHVQAVAQAIAENVEPGGVFSANTVREYLPGWVKPHVVGATFGALARRGALTFVGYEASTQRRTHGHRICVWRLTS